MQEYYNEPTQVGFCEEYDIEHINKNNWLFGIAYQDFIICGCCGGVYRIKEDILEYNCPIIEFEWQDISTEYTIGDYSLSLIEWLNRQAVEQLKTI